MLNNNFPIFKTKIPGDKTIFDLDDPVERKKYFEHKADSEIEKLRDYLRDNTFVGFLIGKKGSGKGTYAKLFAEAVGPNYIEHISVGDIVRSIDAEFKKKDFLDFLKINYRGPIALKDIIKSLSKRSTKILLPTELILALVEREISKLGRKAVFIDGFPRNMDQISYSLYFRALIGYRNDPDFFVFIDVPEAVIDERMKYRVVCPKCQSPRNLKLLCTKQVGYDKNNKKFYLICDQDKTQMRPKEGDELGIEAIRDRIEADDKVAQSLMQMQGVPKIYLRNSLPVSTAKKYVDNYEITQSYSYEFDKQVKIIKKPWVIKDNQGVKSYSLLAPSVVVALIKQMVKILGL
ncbi:MAG: nucleoside monophosphate kinase [bacterium]